MMKNTFGHLFRVSTFGESHGPALGAVVDGCPPMIPLDEEYISSETAKRRPGASIASTTRKEADRVEILSGVFEGLTTGAPIGLLIRNTGARPEDYDHLKDIFRPGHADYTYFKKYGIRDHRGGGRSSGRETAARVAAGAVAARFLEGEEIDVIAYTLELGGVRAETFDPGRIETDPFFCPDPDASRDIAERVEEVKGAGDSLGGIVEAKVVGAPAGLGEPVFGKLSAYLAYAVMGIGAIKGVEIGAGFDAAKRLGSENNDPILPDGFASNNAGGVLGGISTGQDIVLRAAVKPISSIGIEQQTIDAEGRATTIKVEGRHDISAVPRIVPVVKAMIRLAMADMVLMQRAIQK